MKIILIKVALILLLIMPSAVIAANFVVDDNIVIKAVTFGDITADMLILNGANADSITYNSGVFTVVNPGVFKVGSTNAAVKTILVKNSSGTIIYCANNSVPGSSYVTLPTTAAVYKIEPSLTASCISYCTVIAGAGTYYSIGGTFSTPACGVAVCSSPYTLSEASGSITASCNLPAAIISSGGGGGVNKSTSGQTSQISSDGTKIKTDTVGDTMEATIEPSTSPTKNQVVAMNTASSAEVKQVKVGLTSDILKELSAGLSSGQSINVTIQSHEASTEQKTNRARAGMYMVGFDIFSIDIAAGDKKISQLKQSVFLTFNVSGIPQPENLKVYYYNETKKIWEQVGDGGKIVNGELVVLVDHLTNFTLMKEITKTSTAEVLGNSAIQWQNILGEAALLRTDNVKNILLAINKKIDANAEAANEKKYTNNLIFGLNNVSTEARNIITEFVTYGTQSSTKLGAGERAGVVNSYKVAFGKVPTTEAEWTDCLAISNGRWPNAKSAVAEAKAIVEFKKVYKHSPNMKLANDNAAVTIIAYGLRPAKRNLISEQVAIKSYNAIYGSAPVSVAAWDVIRAIAYSGAKR